MMSVNDLSCADWRKSERSTNTGECIEAAVIDR